MIVTPQKTRRNAIASAVLALALVLLLALFSTVRSASLLQLWTIYFPVSLALGLLAYAFLTRKFRRRSKTLAKPFPESRRQILASRVAFYTGLSEVEKSRFEAEVAIFLTEKRITGIKTDVDEATRLLIAASAVIPIFGFPEWEYDNLAEVLVYPASFDSDMQFGEGRDKNILGLVGSSGALNRLMILSKPDLLRSFERPDDGRNVGIHEFTHLIDGADGDVDGVPAATCPDCVKPWIALVHREMARLAAGDSVLSRYGLKSPAEFFAVASEVFFSNPHVLSEAHPELYGLLRQIFQQDTRSIIKNTIAAMFKPHRRGLARNADCPCGENRRFSDCCRKARTASAGSR